MIKPHITECEDGSIVIEWIKKDKRFGIAIEHKPEQSSWFYASKGNKPEDWESACNILSGDLVEYLIKFFE
jgi:hypothetical protein